jgi:hypothetical protein
MDKCNYCGRRIPNEEFRTPKGCKWCDYDYNVEKIIKRNKLAISNQIWYTYDMDKKETL